VLQPVTVNPGDTSLGGSVVGGDGRRGTICTCFVSLVCQLTPGMSAENLLQSIRDQVRIIYERIDPLHQKFRFKSRPTTAEIFSKPLVVFLGTLDDKMFIHPDVGVGNHSSGKSTFVNYILKTSSPSFQDVQKTGVAPLDDGFTFISYGKHMDEQQGPAIVSNANVLDVRCASANMSFRSPAALQFIVEVRSSVCQPSSAQALPRSAAKRCHSRRYVYNRYPRSLCNDATGRFAWYDRFSDGGR
jgi:hypothetical protein